MNVQPLRHPLALLLLGLTIFFQTTASVLSKQAALSLDTFGLLAVATSPWYLAMLIALFLQAVAWLLVLHRLPLALAYPFTSLVFPATLAAAWALFGEEIRPSHLAGTAVILAGIVLIGHSEERAPDDHP